MTSALRKSAWALVIAVCAVSLATAQQPATHVAQTGIIVGTVLDITSSTVPNATVVLEQPNQHRTTTTGRDGFFEFQDLEPSLGGSGDDDRLRPERRDLSARTATRAINRGKRAMVSVSAPPLPVATQK